MAGQTVQPSYRLESATWYLVCRLAIIMVVRRQILPAHSPDVAAVLFVLLYRVISYGM